MNSPKDLSKLFRGGLKLGLLLQIGGIGPIFMLIFRLSLSLPISKLLSAIVGITLADTVYIALAVFSISAVIEKVRGYRNIFDIVVGVVLVILGVLFITSKHSIIDTFDGHNLFFWLFGLTMTNPITILFITGIFSFEISKRNMKLKETIIFALGYLLATPTFMVCVILSGNFIGKFLPEVILQTMNVITGSVLIFLGTRNIFFKNRKTGTLKEN